MGIFSSQPENPTYEGDEFTDDDMSENESTWSDTEDRSLIDAILENTNWSEIADLVQDRDFDRTAEECKARWIELFMSSSVTREDDPDSKP